MFKHTLMQWHRQLGWGAAVALFIWGVSAIMHPTMTWFGPQAEHSFPPRMTVAGDELVNLAPLLSSVPDLGASRVIKLVPGESAPLLQITRNRFSPRQYYELDSMNPLPAHDRSQAQWLASRYTGLPRDSIQQIEFMTGFTDEYPAVNRLLPVYRIAFDDDQHTVAFIHTETGALASLSNSFKNGVQWVFQHLHTFKFLDGLEYGRLILMGLFLLSLLATALIGLMLVFSFKPRPIKDGKRRYHRRLAYVLWLPLLAWSASGFYHLLQASLVDTQFGIRLGEPFTTLTADQVNTDSLQALSGQTVNSLALIRDSERGLYWRASVASELSEEANSRAQRFSGNPAERRALYLPATAATAAAELEDASLAQAMALNFTGASASQIIATSHVTRFGADYDFRNKRLPVWKIELADRDETTVFIDTATGIVVDSNRAVDRLETLSFSILHKWNHLNGLTGTQVRDLLIVATIVLLLLITALGIPLLLNKHKRRRRTVELDGKRPAIV